MTTAPSSTSTSTPESYLLTSRKYYYLDSINYSVGGNYISSSGNILTENFRGLSNGNWRDSRFSAAVRPIITVKSNYVITGGTGSKTNPYTLS